MPGSGRDRSVHEVGRGTDRSVNSGGRECRDEDGFLGKLGSAQAASH